MAIIRVENLTKKFKELVAVDAISLEIKEGECFGLLGPNGAGKTSLIRMITAVSPPAEGSIYITDMNLAEHPREVKSIMGVVPQVDNLDSDLNVIQNLTTYARYFAIPKDEAQRRSLEVLRLFHLEEKKDSGIKELSGGMKRRLLIARGLINAPKIIILDEPSIGLDPQSRHLVWQKLRELKSQGVTELLCTQNMDEAAMLCDRVAIVNQGKILAVGTPRELVAEYAGKQVWETDFMLAEKDSLIKKLRSWHADYDEGNGIIHVFNIDKDRAVDLMDYSGKLRPATLEDVFFKLTGRSLAE